MNGGHTLPTLNTPPAATPEAGMRSMCLLHGDFHAMDGDCWGVTFEWMLDHQHIPEHARRDAYLLEVEQAMLDQHIRHHRPHTPEET